MVITDGIDATQYKLVLIRRSAGEQTFAMASNLSYRSLQKRIEMMTKKKTIEGIDPNTIESVSVLKDKSATELYGKDAKDGVILIVLKKEAK
jgi:TonB-dependent SusC/RagA subfamily outer membrane receptor